MCDLLIFSPIPSLPTQSFLLVCRTELLVYRGQLDASDQPLDATISGMQTTAPTYPMAYGYSLVGSVTGVGAGVPLSLVGQTVFVFAPHAAAALVDADGLIRIPPDIAPAAAAFLPAAETAVSIAHDAHPRLGESVGRNIYIYMCVRVCIHT